jgi:hypothetical protein
MTKVEQWHRRHAVQVAAALPDNTEDGLIILRLAIELVNGFLAAPEPEAKPVVTLIRQERQP